MNFKEIGEGEPEGGQPTVYMGYLWDCGESSGWRFLRIVGKSLYD